jgi:hypothetical protein
MPDEPMPDGETEAEPEDRDWIPMNQNPHADDKRDVLDPAGEELPFKRLIYIGLGIGLLVVALVIWLV